MKHCLFILTAILLSSPCLAQIQERMDRWDSLCMTHPPCKDNNIDSSQIDFYRSLFEILNENERRIPMELHYSLQYYAKYWQWSDSAFLKSLRCFACIQDLFYGFSIQKSIEESIKHYDSLKDTVLVTFARAHSDSWPRQEVEIPFNPSKAKVYCLYYPTDSKCTGDFQKDLQTVEWQGCERAKLVKNGFIHPGRKEGNYSLIILKYSNIYYQIGHVGKGGDVTILIIYEHPRNGRKVEPTKIKVEPAKIEISYNKFMPRVMASEASYDKLKRYSKENKQILRRAMKESKKGGSKER